MYTSRVTGNFSRKKQHCEAQVGSHIDNGAKCVDPQLGQVVGVLPENFVKNA